MGSGIFDLHETNNPEQKKKGRKLKLPRLVPKVNLLKLGLVAVPLSLLGAYAYTGTYEVEENEAAYTLNMLNSDSPFGVDTEPGLHWPWPVGDIPPWPLGKHTVIPLRGSFQGFSAKSSLYTIDFKSLVYSVNPDDVESFVLDYGPYAWSTEPLQEIKDAELSDWIEIITRDRKSLDVVNEVLLSDIITKIEGVQAGKSVEEMNHLKNDAAFMAYLITEVERDLPFLDISVLKIDSVRKNPGVVTVRLADGNLVDMRISLSNGTVDPAVVQGVFADNSLVELRSGILPKYLHDELAEALGINLNENTRGSEFIGFQEDYTPAPTLKVDLGNAQDLFYRTAFPGAFISFVEDMAAQQKALGNLERSISLYRGVLEYSRLYSLEGDALRDVSNSKLALGVIYHELAEDAKDGVNGEYLQAYRGEAAILFRDFLSTASDQDPNFAYVVATLYTSYGDLLDFSELRLIGEDGEDFLGGVGDIVIPGPPSTETSEDDSTAEATESPLLAYFEPKFITGSCDGILAAIENRGNSISGGGELYSFFREGGTFVEGVLDRLTPSKTHEVLLPYDGPGTYRFQLRDAFGQTILFDETIEYTFSCEAPAATSIPEATPLPDNADA